MKKLKDFEAEKVDLRKISGGDAPADGFTIFTHKDAPNTWCTCDA